MKISVFAKPHSREEKVEKMGEDSYIVWVKEPPEKGKANRAIAEALAKHLKVSKSQIKQIFGFTHSNKTFEIFS